MNEGSSDLFNFKPHEIDRNNPFRNYLGLAWQFNYQKSNKKRPNKCWDVKFIITPYLSIMINY